MNAIPVADALADVPEGTIIIDRLQTVPGVDARGLASLWLIFPDWDSRAAYQARYMRTWIETSTAACLIDYANDWRDVNGYGLQLATYCPDRIGLPRTQLRIVL